MMGKQRTQIGRLFGGELRLPPRVAGEPRQDQSGENREDGNDHQHFDKREAKGGRRPPVVGRVESHVSVDDVCVFALAARLAVGTV